MSYSNYYDYKKEEIPFCIQRLKFTLEYYTYEEALALDLFNAINEDVTSADDYYSRLQDYTDGIHGDAFMRYDQDVFRFLEKALEPGIEKHVFKELYESSKDTIDGFDELGPDHLIFSAYLDAILELPYNAIPSSYPTRDDPGDNGMFEWITKSNLFFIDGCNIKEIENNCLDVFKQECKCGKLIKKLTIEPEDDIIDDYFQHD